MNEKHQRLNGALFLIMKLVSIWYLLIFSAFYLTDQTTAYISNQEKTTGKITAGHWVEDQSDVVEETSEEKDKQPNGVEKEDENEQTKENLNEETTNEVKNEEEESSDQEQPVEDKQNENKQTEEKLDEKTNDDINNVEDEQAVEHESNQEQPVKEEIDG
ncbi:hypothetical protein LC087_07310 [Bacillus carboniphilus]|uniref:YqxM n=1 Tax=Bacillus carboniphilus TaxID=86663 RepID=A0ABY9JYR3_9BACI|nr:hypothetical protein [Bacillus carboniphilus]WLR43913.1 hypothetical protein LC087_07310 [Bacillus carboniphilus]